MQYLDFIKDETVITTLKGSDIQEVQNLEDKLNFKLPKSLKEYLLVTGNSASLYNSWDYHGTNDILELKDWIYQWIYQYRNEGILLSELNNILPFFKWQDTFFYVPINGNDNPPVYAFDINDTPTIRKLNDSFTDFVKWKYDEKIKSLK